MAALTPVWAIRPAAYRRDTTATADPSRPPRTSPQPIAGASISTRQRASSRGSGHRDVVAPAEIPAVMRRIIHLGQEAALTVITEVANSAQTRVEAYTPARKRRSQRDGASAYSRVHRRAHTTRAAPMRKAAKAQATVNAIRWSDRGTRIAITRMRTADVKHARLDLTASSSAISRDKAGCGISRTSPETDPPDGREFGIWRVSDSTSTLLLSAASEPVSRRYVIRGLFWPGHFPIVKGGER